MIQRYERVGENRREKYAYFVPKISLLLFYLHVLMQLVVLSGLVWSECGQHEAERSHTLRPPLFQWVYPPLSEQHHSTNIFLHCMEEYTNMLVTKWRGTETSATSTGPHRSEYMLKKAPLFLILMQNWVVQKVLDFWQLMTTTSISFDNCQELHPEKLLLV